MKLKVTFKVLSNIACKYQDTKDYNEENLKEVCDSGRGNLFRCLPLSDVFLSFQFLSE